jgi:hypothetical protein
MVLFLRPTDSSTVFIQQLGRGLRKYDNKEYVTVLDFIGNSYKRSVQIAFAMGSLAENFVIEKRLMKSLVRDNFSALGLEKYGVEIHFDEESQKEIIESIDSENFNSKHYLEQDYYNFKKYINAEFSPKHMDYLNNDCAPDLMRFMQIKINNRKTECYYSFLQGIGEEDLPVFSDEQIKYIKYVSRFLPLVRKHEYVLIQLLLDGPMMENQLRIAAKELIEKCTDDELDHAIKFMLKKAAIDYREGKYALTVNIDDQLKEYLDDLIKYGITQYEIAYRNNEKFVLYHDYRIEQVQLKMLKDPGYIFKGTYFYGEEAFVFASLKKDASVEERLNYKDKFLEPKLFQWECENNISDNDLRALRMSKYVHLFIRKVENENGVQQPYIYVGDGHFNNERKQNKLEKDTGKTNITYLYDIPMDVELPDYLQYDFGLAN